MENLRRKALSLKPSQLRRIFPFLVEQVLLKYQLEWVSFLLIIAPVTGGGSALVVYSSPSLVFHMYFSTYCQSIHVCLDLSGICPSSAGANIARYVEYW